MSLRVKFIIGLLATSLVSLALVWGVAHERLIQKFDRILQERAARNFRGDVASYWMTYGSWEAGQRAEPFGHFITRRKALLARTSNPDDPDHANPNTGDAPVARPIPPWSRPAEATRGPAGEIRNSPFRFLLLDADDKVLSAPDPNDRPGRQASAQEKENALPIEVAGEVVAYAAPIGRINYSETDLAFASAMHDALAWGLAAAAAMAIGLGLLVGTQLSRSLRRLTQAIAGMRDGALRQRVEIAARDEVGVLAEAFNAMSAALAESHRKITEQAAEMREMAIRDALTKLYNRRHFDACTPALLEQAVRDDKPFSVMIGDIDFFKKINDRFSHATGDAVLREVGGLLRTHARADDVVARYGGEEFVIAFPETALADAAAQCERLRQRIEAHPWERIHPDLKVTMSMGLSGELALGSVEAMLKAADALLYEAKTGGRNRVVHRSAAAAPAETQPA